MQNRFLYYKSQGYTLLEIIIAMSISLVLLGAIMQMFENNQRTFSLSTAISEVQENGRFAIDTLVSDLRMVGYQGCADPDGQYERELLQASKTAEDATLLDTNITNGLASFNAESIAGYEVNAANTWVPAFANTDVSAIGTGGEMEDIVKSNSDVLTLKHSLEGVEIATYVLPDNLTSAVAVTAGTLDTSSDLGAIFPLAVDGLTSTTQMIIMGDCDSAAMLTMASVDTVSGAFQVINDTAAIGRTYQPGDLVMPFSSTIYYVKDSGNVDAAGIPIMSLYTRDLINDLGSTEETELVSNVETLQIMYGQMTPTGVLYLQADDPGLVLADVVAVQVGILVRSSERVLSGADPRAYVLPGQTLVVGPPPASPGAIPVADTSSEFLYDGHLRQAFVTTVKLRNRVVNQ